MNELSEPTLLKEYLLGKLQDEIVHGRIEEQLMVDDEYAARVGAAEDELIEEFLDGELSTEDSTKFNQFFLAPPERKRQLRLTRDLRRASASQLSLNPRPTRSQFDLTFSLGWLRFASVAAVILLAALGVWRFAIYQSDTDRGLDQLRAAYRDRRPIESRLTGLQSYAPYSETRGANDSPVTDPGALDKANRYFTDSTTGSTDAAAHQAFANYYLAGRDFVRAEREMDAALKASPNDARIQSDAGAMYLEIARNAESSGDGAKAIVSLNESLKHLDLAVSLDPKLLEPRFNRALAFQAGHNTEQAKAAWREYIELDPNSKWTDEARRNLEKLEENTPRERSAEQLESDFLAAFRAGDEAEAGRLISSNRELIRDKYLPMRLASSFLSAPDDKRDELLNALEYSGNIEMKLTGDPFANEIAHFYRTASPSKYAILTDAHRAIREGFDFCLKGNYEKGLAASQKARSGFETSGDVFTAQLAQYLTGYALKNIPRRKEACAQFNEVEIQARERDFVWLRATALHWAAGCLLDDKQLTNAQRAYEQALSDAHKINDSYAVQRNLGMLAHLHSVCGQQDVALKYLFASLKESDKPETSLRQRYRNTFFVFPILFQAGLISAGKPAAMEAIQLADKLKDEMWMAQSRAFAAIAFAQTGDPDRARVLLEESTIKANAIRAEETRASVGAFSKLRFADFERSLGNIDEAERLYVDALAYYDAVSNVEFLREQVHHGLLQTYRAGGKAAELEAQIPVNVAMTEEYRPLIADEAQSMSFFAVKANIYDIAAEFEFDRGNIEKAYDYAETSSSRSLFDRIRKGLRTSQSASSGADFSRGIEAPLNLTSIKAEMPDDVQIVQYSVFEGKTVIWVISADNFKAVAAPVAAKDLKTKVSELAKSVSSPPSVDHPESATVRSELYRTLIEPVRDQLDPNKELCVVPSDVLFDLPFATLVGPDDKPLISTFRLLLVPSANVFLLSTRLAGARPKGGNESLLAIGNPLFDRAKFNDLPYLRDSEDEVRNISKFYPGSSTMLREEATKDAFLNALPGSDVVHFAGHYVAMPGAPMSSYLLLAADGDDPAKSELSNLELTGLSLSRIRLIVLAACESGVESYYASEGVVGMSRTMLAAQVPLVVASQWAVDSDATAELMTRFHERRANERMPTTAALREAQLDLLNDPSGKFSSPYYWAAFAVYGGHADF